VIVTIREWSVASPIKERIEDVTSVQITGKYTYIYTSRMQYEYDANKENLRIEIDQ
jgi:hypothetical protein